MKIYFSNNKYLTINHVNEEYRSGYRYLNFGFNNNLSFDSVITFLNTENILNKIIITDDKNIVLSTFENVYKAIHSINRSLGEDGNVWFNVQLTSGDGMETANDKTIAREDE